MFPVTTKGAAALQALADAGAFGPFSTHAVYQSWVRGCKAAAREETLAEADRAILREARPYDLRHSFATHVMRTTGDLMLTKELMRHRSTRTTRRYAQSAIPEHLRAAVAKL